MDKVKFIIAQTTITLMKGKVTMYIKKETDNFLFAEAKDILKAGNESQINHLFADVKQKYEKYTNQVFQVENNQLKLKGSNVAIPDLIADKLVELEKKGEDFMPLLRFWKKLQTCETKLVVEQLYGFLIHNNIPITETGDIVTEKGVSQKSGGLPGELVDGWTGTVDNSIGSEVIIERSKVDSDPNRTCSRGLHVGAPDFVRKHWNQKVLIQCIVNPRDVVAVPTDYNNTKMRVCRYIVAGYSPKTPPTQTVMKLEDFLQTPPPETQQVIDEVSGDGNTTAKKNKDNVQSKKVSKSKLKVGKRYINKAKKAIKDLSGSKILKLVEKETGVDMGYNPKSKKTIVKKAIEVLSQHYEAKAKA